ncbi:hypothetical protein SAMN06265349_105291 [Flavobacterium resistens]|uniref:Uncharacterized protein n=1 Tax=Flavobacterium resistens TaxID=443612 RepID=A0A521ERN3_9FLAO|nr:hypothetical protein [Flavobacterium resistens]MRX67915.1 hypothetical protein [Flavobacterium resistens]SMO86575.1 hypothetical protein SAMN06265349_105291 [Flavobacterium resistens]
MWNKKGLIYNVNGEYEWNKSHAQVPVADLLLDRIRIYYATRNTLGKSNVSFIEVDKDEPNKIISENKKPLFNFGKLGTFDDSGIMPSSIVTVGDKKYLYYVGWTTRQSVPYQNAIGLAISDDGGLSFNRISDGPVITVNHIEPYFSGTSYVIFDEGIFKMWYLSCIKWEVYDGKSEPIYNIKYAESLDGINWNQTGKVAIELNDDEGGLVSASVIKENGLYKMWFGKRKQSDYRININNTYRIGYAESTDGINWKRKDNLAGIDISKNGWDSEMISYPNVIQASNNLVMFYNGNGFGKSGFGYALWNEI